MASAVGFTRRIWSATHPPEPPKATDAIRIGLLGASNIAPIAIINPARSHPDVVISAIAARDRVKAEAYAKKYGIAIVHQSYQELIDDATIDAVYIPLPNGLHYEWAVRSLRAGKHVLLEKPSVSNAIEAKLLFDFHASLPSPKPILLEAFHYLFHPAFSLLLSLLTPSAITAVHSNLCAPAKTFPTTDIRFVYDLAGGTLMDMGTYAASILRHTFNAEPEECVSAEPRLMPAPGDQKCDQAFKASWRFPNGGIGTIDVDLAKTGPLGLPWMEVPKVVVVQKAIPATGTQQNDASKVGEWHTHELARTITLANFVQPTFWHRLDIVDEHELKDEKGIVLKKWTRKESRKAYTWSQVVESNEGVGEEWWSTYRYMLEEFVNKVKGRGVPGVWVDGEDSFKQMVMIDSGYVKAGMDIRPTSTFK